MFLAMGIYGTISIVASIIAAVIIGAASIGEGYGKGKPNGLAIGLIILALAVGEIIFFGMVMFGWFRDVPR